MKFSASYLLPIREGSQNQSQVQFTKSVYPCSVNSFSTRKRHHLQIDRIIDLYSGKPPCLLHFRRRKLELLDLAPTPNSVGSIAIDRFAK